MGLMHTSIKMVRQFVKTADAHKRAFRSMPVCLLISFLGHLAGLYASVLFNPFELRGPVIQPAAVSLVLEEAVAEATDDHRRHTDAASDSSAGPSKPTHEPGHGARRQAAGPQTFALPGGTKAATAEATAHAEGVQTEAPGMEQAAVDTVEHGAKISAGASPAPDASVSVQQGQGVRQPGEFMSDAREKLVYRLSLGNIPAGTAVIEATNTNGEIRITAKLTSNDFLSAFYPVDDFIDTRLIKGNYIVTRIRKREGNSVSDTGFTLMLRERTAFWVDRLRERYLNTPIPRDDVTDLVTGFYFMRNLPLEVGKSVVLHLFDGSRYAATAVEVVKKERLNLPGFREAETVVVRPRLSASGFLAGTGPLLIWLTDDEKRVPVRLETSIRWGSVRAELISAESGAR